jgi:hypothetical protein
MNFSSMSLWSLKPAVNLWQLLNNMYSHNKHIYYCICSLLTYSEHIKSFKNVSRKLFFIVHYILNMKSLTLKSYVQYQAMYAGYTTKNNYHFESVFLSFHTFILCLIVVHWILCVHVLICLCIIENNKKKN